jgi:hypothetical protein
MHHMRLTSQEEKEGQSLENFGEFAFHALG